MLAARGYRGERMLRLEDVEIPEINDTELLVRNRASGINRGTIAVWRSGRMMPLLPTILSNQIAGDVAAVGKAVSDVQVGDRVLVHAILSCGQCELCRSGEDAECSAAMNMGHIAFGEGGLPLYQRYHHGGLSEYVRVPASSIERLPPSLSYEAAAKILSYGVSYRSLSRLDVRPGATIAINGISGAFGAAAALLAPFFQIGRIIGIARSEASLARVRPLLPMIEFVTLDGLGDDWAKNDGLRRRILAQTGSTGLDAALDFSPAGTPATLQMLAALRKGGTLVLAGGNHENLTLPYVSIMANAVSIRGSKASNRTSTRTLLKLAASGRIDLSRLISHHFELSNVNEAIRMIDERAERPLFISVSIP